MLRLAALLLLVACSARRVYVHDVVEAFAADEARLAIRAPTSDDLQPARAANADEAMGRTEWLARRYLAQRGGERSLHADYVRALLACALLAQGRNPEARDALAGLQARRENEPIPEKAVVSAAIYATGVGRALEARAALEELFAGQSRDVAGFLEQWGSFVGMPVKPADEPDAAAALARQVAAFEAHCFDVAGERAEERRDYHRAAVRRLVSELVYDEAASLLTVVPETRRPPDGAVDRWLARVAVASFVTFGYVMRDVVPPGLDRERRRRRQKHAMSVYERAKEMAERFLPEDARAVPVSGRAAAYGDLYAELLAAEDRALAAIARGS